MEAGTHRTEPTVTDAHVALGHLPPYLLGGTFALDVDGARRAIAQRVAAPLGLDVDDAARGILAVVDNNMVGAMRVVSIERGVDPASLAFVPFGGAGPLHAGPLARLIGCTTTLIAPAPGVLSALGLLASNLRAEFSRTCLQRAGHYDVPRLGAVLDELAAEANAWLEAEAVPPAARLLLPQASLRYKDQGFELDVPWREAAGRAGPVDALLDGFHAAHERLYGFALRGTAVEIVTLRVDAVGMLPTVAAETLPEAGPVADARIGTQTVAFASGRTDVPVYERSRLGAGAAIEGPAIVVQLDSTTLLLPGQIARVHRHGALIVTEVG